MIKLPVVVCFVSVVLISYILANEEEIAEVCSYSLKRKMLIKHCGNARKRRGAYTYFDITNQKKRRYHHIDVIANDTSGGVLIRNKRGKYEYCCLPAKNGCHRVFPC